MIVSTPTNGSAGSGSEAGQDAVEPSWHPPVAPAEQIHGRGDEDQPYDGGGEAEGHPLDDDVLGKGKGV